jgi:thiamine monophosphate kinase
VRHRRPGRRRRAGAGLPGGVELTSLRDLGELGLLERLRPLLGAPLDDDVAVWPEPDGSFTVATCDTFVDGRHFDLGWMAPEDAGWRACALTLADLAAKAAEPAYGLVSLQAPPEQDAAIVERLYAGLAECAAAFGLRLVGGDTVAADALSLTVVALGRAGAEPLPRSAVRPGWLVGVTGPLGAEAAALAARRATRPRPYWWRHGGAAGDISDGLLRELAKFGVGAEIESAKVPVADGATLDQALTSGEEVHFVVGSPEEIGGMIPIGRFTGDGRVLVDGEERAGGYDHFA